MTTIKIRELLKTDKLIILLFGLVLLAGVFYLSMSVSSKFESAILPLDSLLQSKLGGE